jgi:hypothetical protein
LENERATGSKTATRNKQRKRKNRQKNEYNVYKTQLASVHATDATDGVTEEVKRLRAPAIKDCERMQLRLVLTAIQHALEVRKIMFPKQ